MKKLAIGDRVRVVDWSFSLSLTYGYPHPQIKKHDYIGVDSIFIILDFIQKGPAHNLLTGQPMQYSDVIIQSVDTEEKILTQVRFLLHESESRDTSFPLLDEELFYE